MGDCTSVAPGLDGEENLIAAAQHIVKALGSNKNLTDDVRKILVDLGTQLSTISRADESKDVGINEIEYRLNAAQEKVMSWEADQCMVWDSGPEEVAEYLKAVEEVRKLTEILESLSLNKDSEVNELLRRAYDVLQTAMARLEEEFRHLLFQNRQPFEPEQHMSFRSNDEDAVDEGSIISFEDDPVDESLQSDSISRSSEDYIIHLVHPDVIPDLKSIANLMLSSNYDHECSQAYISVRKDALDECLAILEMEKLSIEDVLRMEWAGLNSKIRRWVRAIKIFVRAYLASEKWLSDQVFGEVGSVSSVCFVEASRSSIFQLLNFGEAVVIGPHKPEKLMRILDMYEVLAELLPEIDAIYQGEIGFSVRTECREVLGGLGDCVRATFLEFENAIASNASTNPFAGGGIHPLTRYVMNYIKILTDYCNIINFLFKDHDKADPGSLPSTSPVTEEDDKSGSSACSSAMGLHFRALISILECNLEEKSKLYRDVALQHLFLMNNIHYMAEKVKNSELRVVFGDEWIRKHNWKFQQHAMNYERASWSSILLLLKDEGIQNSNSSSPSKTVLKDRLRSFNMAFEELYKSQTTWLIPDSQLRDELQISTSLKVVQAYRTFVGRHNTHISDKHIKYSPDDLQNFLLDLFVGYPKSLPNPHRR